MKARVALTLAAIVLLPSLTVAVAPGNPQNLAVTVLGNTVTLTWNAPSVGGVPTGYIVHASLSPGGPIIASLPVSDTRLVVTDVPNGVYYVHVRAVNIDGTSGSSNEVIASVPSGPGGCTSRPNAPTNLMSTVAGSLVTLTWAAPVGGCGATSYAVQAGSAPGLTDLAILNVGAATNLSVSAPPGTYYVRVVAMNAFGGSIPSVEIIVRVGTTRERVTVSFSALSSVVDRSPVTSYSESDFIVTPTAQAWVATPAFGNPAPSIQFVRLASQGTLVGEVTVTSATGALFEFESVDLYSSVTTIPHEVIGVRGGVAVFAFSGTVPNTFGQFATVTNPHSATAIDTLLIRVSNPATACCNNPTGIDNLVLDR
jgi:hypothetical protein